MEPYKAITLVKVQSLVNWIPADTIVEVWAETVDLAFVTGPGKQGWYEFPGPVTIHGVRKTDLERIER